MDRLIQYPAQIPLVEDMLNAQRNAMVGIGHLAGAAFGANTVAASGFACAPGEGLALTLAPGALLAPGVVDASAYGALAAVSSALVRQFISRDPVTLAVPAAGATYIVSAAPQTVDTDDTVLPFYNAADPSVTYAGEGNSGLAAPTARRDEVALSIGASVPEGSYPLWQIIVPAGATAITADMISVASGAPFYPSLAAVAPRIVAPFNAQLAVAMGGYPLNAVVADPETPGTFWVSTADANTTVPGTNGANWKSLFDGLQTALGFTPVAQWSDANTIGMAQLGWSTYLSCVVGRETDGTLRCLISSDPTVSTYEPISQIARIASSGQLIVTGTDGNLTYYVPQSYVDDAVAACVSGIYGKGDSDFQMLGLFQQASTGRPIASYNNGTATVQEQLAVIDDVQLVQSNLTNAVAAQANTNGQITALVNSKVGQWSDANTSPITEFGYSTANQALVARDGTGTLRNPVMSLASTGYIAVTNLTIIQSNNCLLAKGWDGGFRYYYDTKSIDAINTALTTRTTNSAEAAVFVAGSTSVTVPSGFTRIEIRGVGAGGGGGGCQGTSTADVISGAGGGSGPYVEAVYPVSPGDVIEFTIGAGGAGGVGGTGEAGAGSAGGTTTVAKNGNQLFILYGGKGGGKPTNVNTAGGDGGRFDVPESGNVFVNAGTDGSDGQTSTFVFAGNGAGSAYGGGGRAGNGGGHSASGYGGGGGGAYDAYLTGTSYTGGNGGGAVLFYRFLI